MMDEFVRRHGEENDSRSPLTFQSFAACSRFEGFFLFFLLLVDLIRPTPCYNEEARSICYVLIAQCVRLA
uniref:Uncharacterized protein n=1 Tax=Setaria italica TaxID=4555 RepID=K3ZG51_SETIT